MSVIKQGRKGLTYYNPMKAFNGYNLFWPMGSKDCWLMDMQGRFVHRWRMPFPPGLHAYLMPNGNLLGACRVKEPQEYPYGWGPEFNGCGGLLFEMDWDGKIVWQLEVSGQGHDHTPMANGHILYMAYEPKGNVPDEIAARVKGGLPGSEQQGKIWGDTLIEVDREGNRVWEWLAYEHLDPEIDAICQLEKRTQWPMFNSVVELLDGNIMTSARSCNEVIKIEYKTGKVIGRYGRGNLAHQHDARELENGNITVFDNGSHRHEYSPEYSQVIELDPKTDEIVWAYKADPPSDFYTAACGGAERQPNGNTVIIESDSGRMFEVTHEGEIVWEYVYPRYVHYIGRFTNRIWRVHRYPADYAGLKGRDLDPEKLGWVNRICGPEAFTKEIKPCLF